METVDQTAAAVASAVTGPSSPDNVKVNRPTKESVWMLLLAMGLASMVSVILIYALTWVRWPDEVAHSRIMWLGIMACMSQLAIPITIIALASSRLGKVEATAGTNSITIDGTGGQ
jgi:hypothetical protein